MQYCNKPYNYKLNMIYDIADGIIDDLWQHLMFDLDYNKKYCSGLLFVRQLSTRINTSAVYDNQLWMYENGFYYTSTRYGRIGIVQSERMINAHMICTQKQMKDIRGMRV